MKGKFLASLFAVAVMAIAFAGNSAQAVPIDGDVSFVGTYTVDNASNLSLATRFTSFSGVSVMAEPAVDNGDYEGTDGIATAFTPFTFAGPGAVASVDPLWLFHSGPFTFSFKATSVGVSFANKNALVVEGEGIAHITGFDDTPGFWSITANKGRTSFSFSSSSSALIPEPASIGVAALGLGTILLRRRKTA